MTDSWVKRARQVASALICATVSSVGERAAVDESGEGVYQAMDLPTPREVELESLLRQRDAQLADLTVRLPIAGAVSRAMRC